MNASCSSISAQGKPPDILRRTALAGSPAPSVATAMVDLSAPACSTPPMQIDELTAIITATLSNTPRWIRHDLVATDRMLRTRAEESLAAIIAAAVRQSNSETH